MITFAELETHFKTHLYDEAHLTEVEHEKYFGANWVIAKRTKNIVDHYGEDVNCISPEKYRLLETQAYRDRGYKRPVQLLIKDLRAHITNFYPFPFLPDQEHPAVMAARKLLDDLA